MAININLIDDKFWRAVINPLNIDRYSVFTRFNAITGCNGKSKCRDIIIIRIK